MYMYMYAGRSNEQWPANAALPIAEYRWRDSHLERSLASLYLHGLKLPYQHQLVARPPSVGGSTPRLDWAGLDDHVDRCRSR